MIEAIFGLIGVVVGSFLRIAKDSFAARRQRKKDGSYSAIRLICILHEYADHCVDVVCDDGTWHGQPAGRTESGVYYDPQVRQPEPPQYPDDIAWRSLPESLMHQIPGLPNKARATDRYIYMANLNLLRPRQTTLSYLRRGKKGMQSQVMMH